MEIAISSIEGRMTEWLRVPVVTIGRDRICCDHLCVQWWVSHAEDTLTRKLLSSRADLRPLGASPGLRQLQAAVRVPWRLALKLQPASWSVLTVALGAPL